MRALSATLLFLLIQLAPSVLAVPNQHSRPRATSSGPINIDLLRKRYGPTNQSSVDEWGVWAKNQRDSLRSKYNQTPNQKRSSGENLSVIYFGGLFVVIFIAETPGSARRGVGQT
jgi:hypothetical protein